MNRDSGKVHKTRKHLSAPSSLTKQNRKTFQTVSGSSSLSSNRNSSGQSDDENGLYLRQPVTNASSEDKDSLIKKLQSQVKELRNKLRVLEECIENKDFSLGTTAREKDRALGEVRRLERSNKQLRQQLNDERIHYLEEKEMFCKEMTRYKKRLQEVKMFGDPSKSLRGSATVASERKVSAGTWQKGDSAEVHPASKDGGGIRVVAVASEFRKSTSLDSFTLYDGQDLSLQMAALRTENAKLRAIVNEREERNYELCLRFLRMKHSKNDLRNRFQDLENEYLQVITNLMEKIDEAREEFNFIIDEKFKKPLHSRNAKYLRMVQRNSKIAFENITLRMELQNLKKELNKRNLGQGDYQRKTPDDETKPMLDDKSKKSKKNDNQNETRQGNEGNLVPKASDTDSNYMSKTSTTDPSTGSLRDDKSNESIYGDAFESGKNKSANNPQNMLFSEDILQKIFERVDSQSTLDTPREVEKDNLAAGASKTDAKTRGKRKPTERAKFGLNAPAERQREIPPPEEGTGKRYVVCSLHSKKFHEVVSNTVTKKPSTVKKEKKSVQHMDIGLEKEKIPELPRSRRRVTEAGDRPKSRSHFTEIKDSVRSYPDSENADLPKEGMNLKGSSSWNRVRDKKMQGRLEGGAGYEIEGPRRYRSRKDRRQRIYVRDSCGLEEKLDTDAEISPDFDYDTSGRKPKGEKTIDQMAMVKQRIPDDLRERTREKVWHEDDLKDDLDTNSDDSAFGSSRGKTRHRNTVSLHDELMEATKSQPRMDDPFWRRELNLHSLITKKSASSSRTYRLTKRNSRFMSEGHKTPENLDEDYGRHHAVTKAETKVLRKEDERKRSRSESPTGSKRGSPPTSSRVATHKTIATDSDFLIDRNSEVRFLMPPAAISSNQSFLFGEEEPYKKSTDKDRGSPLQSMHHQISHLMLPGSNMPSSSATMEMADSSAARENGLTSRTISAPALLESEWLNTFKLYEMKDCSTNT